MNPCRLILIGAVLLGSVYAAEESVGGSAGSSRDTGVLTLPGPAPKPAPPVVAPPPAPPKADLPEGFTSESSVYLQHVIGIWKVRDAQALLGMPTRNRPAYDEGRKVNGQIYAWIDPTGRYRDLELDFEASSGTLRTVFAYPKEMTWDDCRKIWGAEVNSTPAKNGRTFYSYLKRKLDVLVDHGGKVISLGLY